MHGTESTDITDMFKEHMNLLDFLISVGNLLPPTLPPPPHTGTALRDQHGITKAAHSKKQEVTTVTLRSVY